MKLGCPPLWHLELGVWTPAQPRPPWGGCGCAPGTPTRLPALCAAAYVACPPYREPPTHLLHVPRNRLPFSVGVRGQYEARALAQRVGDFAQLVLATSVHLPPHCEVLLRPHGAGFRDQIPHVAVRSEHGVAWPQIRLDGLGLLGFIERWAQSLSQESGCGGGTWGVHG